MNRDNDGPNTDACDLPGGGAAAPGPALAGARPAESDPWAAAMRRVIAAGDGPPSIHDVAHALGVSARTLQRHLRSLGTTFRQEAKAARGERADGRPAPPPARRLFGLPPAASPAVPALVETASAA